MVVGLDLAPKGIGAGAPGVPIAPGAVFGLEVAPRLALGAGLSITSSDGLRPASCTSEADVVFSNLGVEGGNGLLIGYSKAGISPESSMYRGRSLWRARRF